MRALLIEDDAAMLQTIAVMLHSEDFVCDTASLGAEGLEVSRLYDYDIVVLDLMLPDMDGDEVLRRLRRMRVQTPVLVLSGLGDIDDKVKCLGVGADDYMTKPFDKRELIARIRAIVRRAQGHPNPVIETGQLSVNLNCRTAQVDGRSLHLTGKEYGILELLSLRKGTILSKETLLNHLYGGLDEPELSIFDAFICKIRKKLTAATGGEDYIDTAWGRGYVLRDPVAQGGKENAITDGVMANAA